MSMPTKRTDHLVSRCDDRMKGKRSAVTRSSRITKGRVIETAFLVPRLPAETKTNGVVGFIYVIDRPQGSCGVCDIPEVLRGGAE